MKSPKDTPSSPRFPAEKLVVAGCQRLPGLSGLEKPSMKMMVMMSSVDRMPRIDAYDNRDKGISMVGTMLEHREQSQQ